jgi:hypothetical protein
MTLSLSVTPHVEATHTRWDLEEGNQLPNHYGVATRTEREASLRAMSNAVLERHLAACRKLDEAAGENLSVQRDATIQLRSALAGAVPGTPASE